MAVLKYWDPVSQSYQPLITPGQGEPGPAGPQGPPGPQGPAGPPGSGGGVSDHGALSGLGDNDHPQYALASSLGNSATRAVGSGSGDVASGNAPAVAAAAAVSAHEAGGNPHPIYLTQAEADALYLSIAASVARPAGALWSYVTAPVSPQEPYLLLFDNGDGTRTWRYEDGIPGAPTGIGATPGNAQATVSWTAPSARGVGTLTYTVERSSDGGATWGNPVNGVTGTSVVVTGLTNGTAYRFRVRATTATGSTVWGTSAWNTLGSDVTPAGAGTAPLAPAAPTVAFASLTSINATAVAPGNGGQPITDYVWQYSSNGGTSWTTFADGTGTGLTAAITGLTAGQTYIVRVAAVNSIGQGSYSAASSPVFLATAPAAPAAPTGTAGDAQVTVNWVAPASNGSAISTYTVQRATNAGFTTGVVTLTTTVTGTTYVNNVTNGNPPANGTAYYYRVLATNAVGSSAYSGASAALTPVSSGSTPTYRGRAFKQIASGNLTLATTDYDVAPVAGDRIVVVVAQYGGPGSYDPAGETQFASVPSTPSGWTAVPAATLGLVSEAPGDFLVSMFHKVAAGNSSDNFAATGMGGSPYVIMATTSAAAAFVGFGGASDGPTGATGAAAGAPLAAAAGDIISWFGIHVRASGTAGGSWTPASGVTERVDAAATGGTFYFMIGTEVFATAGSRNFGMTAAAGDGWALTCAAVR